MFTVAIGVAMVGTAGLVVSATALLGTIDREPRLDGVMSEESQTVENFLLVGSDSRAGADPDAADFSTIGSEANVTGRRSDTVMLIRRDNTSSSTAVLSIPRDLWLPIDGGDSNRINTAYGEGPDVLVRTVQEELGIPVHHYLEVDFSGFKSIVDSVGGVEICFANDVRDRQVGFFARSGCHLLGGQRALRYARARYFEVLENGAWQRDGSSDLGRGTRQRRFLSALAGRALDAVAEDPFALGRISSSMLGAVRIDPRTDVLDALIALRSLAGTDVRSYALEVYSDTVGDASILRLSDRAESQLSYFAGTGPAPEGE